MNEDNVNAQEAEIQVTAETAGAETDSAAAGLGKFRSVDALMAAYTSLEAEFTRRSQRLKELEEGNKAQEMPAEGAPSQGGGTGRERLLQAALSDEGVRRAVIEEYLKTVTANKSIPLIVGGVSTPAPKSAPKSVKEAGALAERFLKN